MHMRSDHWIRGLILVILYCVFFLKTIISGFHPGPKGSPKMLDRVIRAGGGIFLLLAMLLMLYVVNRYPHK